MPEPEPPWGDASAGPARNSLHAGAAPAGATTFGAGPGMPMGRFLLLLMLGQIGVHSAMSGLRMSLALHALREGHTVATVGLVLALFAAAPVLNMFYIGRQADRLGYHRMVKAGMLLTLGGAAAALASNWAPGPWRFGLWCVAAATCGTAANLAVLTVQRTASLAVRDAAERMRVFSWLSAAPPVSNVIGPVVAGLAIDAAGFGLAYGVLLLMPALTWAAARRVPRDGPAAPSANPVPPSSQRTLDLFGVPGMRRILLFNWFFSVAWDVQQFAVPILGHERGFSASTIGLVLAAFTAGVTGVRLLMPLLLHQVNERQLLRGSTAATAVVLAAYPFANHAAVMGLLSVLLGVALGTVQPVVMAMLHHLSPPARHGEVLALRSVTLNASSTAMPLLLGAAGAVIGSAALFWTAALAVASGLGLLGRDAPGSAPTPGAR